MFFKWQNGFLSITRKTSLANWSCIPKRRNFYSGIDKTDEASVLQVAQRFPKYNKKSFPCELKLDSQKPQICRSLPARVTKTARFDLIRILTISGHAFTHEAVSCYPF